MDYEELSPGVAVVATHLRHVSHLREALLRIQQDLEARAERHDRSKLGPEELPGFARINRAAREHPYGSDEYKDSLAREQCTVDAHYRGNSHHPEHHASDREMGFLDVIEMVCDWQAAAKTYGKGGLLEDSLEINRKRFDFSDEQWWLIEQVAGFLNPGGE